MFAPIPKTSSHFDAGPVINPHHLPMAPTTNLKNKTTGNGAGGVGWKTYGDRLVYDTLMSKGAGVAIVAGIASSLFLETNVAESINFAALSALSSTVGDAALIALGIDKDIDSYLKPTAYYDASDFVGTAGMFALFGSMEGIPMSGLTLPIILAGVAGATGGRLVSYFLKEIKINKPGN